MAEKGCFEEWMSLHAAPVEDPAQDLGLQFDLVVFTDRSPGMRKDSPKKVSIAFPVPLPGSSGIRTSGTPNPQP